MGGSAKAYNAEEAKQAVGVLNPKLVIPTHYRTQAADPNSCDITPVDDFLALMDGMNVRRSNGDTVSITSGNLKENTEIQVLSYQF